MGYAIKLQPAAMQIYNGDKVDVDLTGSNTGTFTFTVVYVAKDEVCLLSDSNMGNANWSTACAKSWGWSCKIGGKSYSSSDAGQSVAKIPTLEQFACKCSNYSDSIGTNKTAYLLTADDGGRGFVIWEKSYSLPQTFIGSSLYGASTSTARVVLPYIDIIR